MVATQEEFVDSGGSQCPVCQDGSIQLTDGPNMLTSGGLIECYAQCDWCGSIWKKEYTLVKYVLLEQRFDYTL